MTVVSLAKKMSSEVYSWFRKDSQFPAYREKAMYATTPVTKRVLTSKQDAEKFRSKHALRRDSRESYHSTGIWLAAFPSELQKCLQIKSTISYQKQRRRQTSSGDTSSPDPWVARSGPSKTTQRSLIKMLFRSKGSSAHRPQSRPCLKWSCRRLTWLQQELTFLL